MKTTVISDLHGYLPTIEQCELLLICGDIVPLNIQRNHEKSYEWFVKEFKDWAEAQPVDKVIFIAGNHDFVFEGAYAEDLKIEFGSQKKVTYIENDWYIHQSKDGKAYLIYGTPLCTWFGNWAFNREDSNLYGNYSSIPIGCDILMSHDAPAIGNLGTIMEDGDRKGYEVGSIPLATTVLRVHPKYTFCGHIHSGEHEVVTTTYQDGKPMIYANVSLKNEEYKAVNKPLVIDICKD